VVSENASTFFEKVLPSFQNFLRVISRRALTVTFNDFDFPSLTSEGSEFACFQKLSHCHTPNVPIDNISRHVLWQKKSPAEAGQFN
jgi:hypothetical protein